MRLTVRQAGAAVPVRIISSGIEINWETVLEAPEFSVPDTQRRFINDRDPLDDDRRIQPGFALIESPLMFFNNSSSTVTLEIRVLTEDGLELPQAKIDILSFDTFLHPLPGQRLLKLNKNSANGDRLQVKSSEANVITLSSTGSIGAAEQNEPEFV